MKIVVYTPAIPVLLIAMYLFMPSLSHAQNCGSSGVQMVTNTTDEGPGSLRQAIDCANNSPGADTIRFNIPGAGPHYIYVGSTTAEALPALSDTATIIDGSTQTGYSPNLSPRIVLDGSQTNWTIPINAIWIRADRCEVYALEIRNFPDDGIDVRAADEVQIGAAGKGNVIYSNGWPLDYFPGIPGSGPWEGCAIVLRQGSNNCRILSNILGTDFSQSLDLGNEYCGVIVQDGGNGHRIGGTEPGERNVIAHNAVGVRVGSGSQACSMIRNSLFCNDTLAIDLRPGANNDQLPPLIDIAVPAQISGQAGDGELVEVYVNDPSACTAAACQGRFYLGSTLATGGNWSLTAPYDLGYVLLGGEVVTAVATSSGGNSSEFANCRVVSGSSNCTDTLGNIIVTNIADEGPGTLRAAIDCANSTPGANTIRFNIPGNGPHRIFVGSSTGEPLPALTDVSTILDATSQPGYGQNNNFRPRIILDGSQNDWTVPINAIWIRASYCQVYGLEITEFPDDGIDITGADYVTIGGINKGNVIYKNGYDQDYFPGAPNSGPWNGCGIVMKSGSHHCIIQGNMLGTNYIGNLIAPNELCGIVVQSGGDLHLIGGTVPGQGNIIAHHEEGIRIGSNSYGCSILQNSMYCNILPINLTGNANFALSPPVIDSASTVYISGTAATTEIVDIYLLGADTCSAAACQGKTWIGRATVNNGSWELQPPFIAGLEPLEGDQLTALATDTLGNTSTFAACIEVKAGCALELSIAQLTDASCNESNGSFEVLMSNGQAPFTFLLNGDPEPDAMISGLAAGVYTLIATDAASCTDTLSVQINDSGIPQLSLTGQSDASCGLPNGSFEVAATNGLPPYSFDIGNGPQAGGLFTGLGSATYSVVVMDAADCPVSLDVVVGDTGTPFMSVTNIQHATCGQSDGSFSVSAFGGEAPYTYDIGNGPTSDTFFVNLATGMYTVTLTDVNSCQTTASVIISNETILPQAGFSFIPEADTVHFSNLSQSGTTFSWNFGDGAVSGAANPSHLYSRNDQFTVCLTADNSCGSDTYCESIDVVFPLFIGGTVWREDGIPVGQVHLISGGVLTQTNSDGGYLFDNMPPGNDYTLVPEKDINWTNGLTTFDIYLIQQHILDVAALPSPYRMIAADLNRSGTITTFDLYHLRRLILGVDYDVPGNTSWRFVAADHQFSNPSNPFSSSFPEAIELYALDRHVYLKDFIAIKTGDINLSNDPLSLEAPGEELTLRCDLEHSKEGPFIWLNFRAEDFESMAGLQFDLQFDASNLRYDGIGLAGLEGFGEAQIGTYQAEAGRLALAWHEVNGKLAGCTIEDDALLFQLRFEVLNPAFNLENAFEITTERSIAQAFRNNGEARTVKFKFAEDSLPATSLPSAKFQLLENQPNPFREGTTIRFYLPQAGPVQISLYDLSGKLILEKGMQASEGWQKEVIDAQALGLHSGLYLLRLQSEAQSGILKLLVERD